MVFRSKIAEREGGCCRFRGKAKNPTEDSKERSQTWQGTPEEVLLNVHNWFWAIFLMIMVVLVFVALLACTFLAPR
jgi:hypothetical protein